ncbi:3922_t:CDS:2, partial [Dentiscutata erythropus]
VFNDQSCTTISRVYQLPEEAFQIDIQSLPTKPIMSWNLLLEILKPENFEVPNFKLDTFVDVNSIERACEWFTEFQSWSKTTMPETKKFEIKEKRILFQELRHCIHSDQVKKKQSHREVKYPYSSWARNINCTTAIHLQLEHQ